MADSIILATARACDVTLWTQDEHSKGIEGVRYKAKKSKNKFEKGSRITLYPSPLI